MNLENNKNVKEIIDNLRNWQKFKNNPPLLLELLSKASYFEIDNSSSEDESACYHLYPAVEIEEDSEKKLEAYSLIFYMISKNRDNKEFLDKNKDHIDQYINKFQVINRHLNEDTEISKEVAEIRKKRWSHEIEKWLSENEVFEVFEIPTGDFKFNDDHVVMQGHFGIKDRKREKIFTTRGSNKSLSFKFIIEKI
ncbi:hypothetical protein [Flavobacterium sp. HSC-61S13]|uniref:hypothetical protein n=1 Tax=Flavobacterium sp. HSC-61S13 TaxID=2910963 RepID=UPI00209FDC39|nr:hypothetical protein [Flavobacterium sp. HSC-61S13]MCP1994617.1 hypothetical protein [Flavobacterium sp. HSC-61S13]